METEMNNVENEYLDQVVLNELDEETHHKLNKLIYNNSVLTGKIHGSLEDPLSQIFYDISDLVSPSLHDARISPNFITTVRTILMIVVFPYLWVNRMYRSAGIVYMLAYFGDCLDGHLSRKYNLETTFGDYYDHMSDILGFIISIYFITVTLSDENKWIIILIICACLLSLVQLGCQERYLKLMGINKDSHTLTPVNIFCPVSAIDDDDIEDTMDVTKFFGVGIYILFTFILMWNFEYLESK